MKTTLLIDGDVEVFKAATVSQENIDWGNGVSVDLDEQGAESYLDSALSHYSDVLDTDQIIVCLTDKDNWRKKLWPDYKANRKDIARPLLLSHCRDYLARHYRTECWPRLEADDVMGILSTTIPKSIVVSVDKDMRGVPCRLFNPGKPELGVVSISPLEAFRWHMMQTLMGDATDGYKGCPGIGLKKAAAIIDEACSDELPQRGSVIDSVYDHKLIEEKIWKAVMDTYQAKKRTVCEARLNARLAYILRHPREYSRETHKMRLWQPPL